MTNIELTEQEVELFKKFRQHQTDFDILLRYGIFDFKGGQAIIHRDKDRKIRKIEIKRITYNL